MHLGHRGVGDRRQHGLSLDSALSQSFILELFVRRLSVCYCFVRHYLILALHDEVCMVSSLTSVDCICSRTIGSLLCTTIMSTRNQQQANMTGNEQRLIWSARNLQYILHSALEFTYYVGLLPLEFIQVCHTTQSTSKTIQPILCATEYSLVHNS